MRERSEINGTSMFSSQEARYGARAPWRQPCPADHTGRSGQSGGATATHVRIGEEFFFPIVIGVIAWIALGMRQPDVFRLAPGNPNTMKEGE
jgi:hypothetical protein